MILAERLKIRSGVTAVIGSGGKTTLLRHLGEELTRAGHSVLLCTTTHFLPFDGIPLDMSDDEYTLRELLSEARLVCTGTIAAESGKLSASGISMARLSALADYVLVEADGAKGLPLKAHAPWEPVIPPEANQTICVVGLSGIGRPVAETVHRPERFTALSGCLDTVTISALSAVLNREALADRYLLNQADTEEDTRTGYRLAERLQRPAVIGSLHRNVWNVECGKRTAVNG